MTRLIVESQVGADGVLRLAVPVGTGEANQAVKVTIESLSTPGAEQANYVAWLDRITGKWQGDFERMPQGDFEPRDAL